MYQTYDAVLFPANRGRLSRRAPVIRASWFPVVSLQSRVPSPPLPPPVPPPTPFPAGFNAEPARTA